MKSSKSIKTISLSLFQSCHDFLFPTANENIEVVHTSQKSLIIKQLTFLLLLATFSLSIISLSVNTSHNGVETYQQTLDTIYVEPKSLNEPEERKFETVSNDIDVKGVSDMNAWYPLCTKKNASISLSNYITDRQIENSQSSTITITPYTTLELKSISVPVKVIAGRTGCSIRSCPPSKNEEGEIFAKYPSIGDVFGLYAITNPYQQQNQYKDVINKSGEYNGVKISLPNSVSSVLAAAVLEVKGQEKSSDIVAVSYKNPSPQSDKFVNQSNINPDIRNVSAQISVDAISNPGSKNNRTVENKDTCVDISGDQYKIIEINETGYTARVNNPNPVSFSQQITKRVEEWQYCNDNPSSCREQIVVGVAVAGFTGSNFGGSDYYCADCAEDKIIMASLAPGHSFLKNNKEASVTNALKDIYLSTPCTLLKDGYEEIKTRCLYNVSYIVNHYRSWKLVTNPSRQKEKMPTEAEYLDVLIETWKREGSI